MFYRALSGSLVFLACISAQETAFQDTAYRGLDVIYGLMDKSKYIYLIDEIDGASSNILYDSMTPDEIFGLADYKIVKQSDSTQIIEFMEPSEKAIAFIERAETAMRGGDFESARDYYYHILDLDSTYLKAYTLIGHTYSLEGDYEKAIELLTQAIALNPIDYQAYWWLGDIYAAMGDDKAAMRCLTYAFMLNKENPLLLLSVEKLLKTKGMKIRKDRFVVPVMISITGDTTRILFEKKTGAEWIGYALTRACWETEPDLQKLILENDLGKQQMYKECLINQALYTETMIREKKKVSAQAKYLHDAVFAKYLYVILLWEIVGSINGKVVFLLPQETKDRIVEYIEKYVYYSEL